VTTSHNVFRRRDSESIMTKRKKTSANAGLNLSEAYLQHVLMNETKDYLERGQRFAQISIDQLNEAWVTAFRTYFATRLRRSALNMDDLAAELRLRGRDPPFGAVQSEIADLRAELERVNPDEAYAALDRQMDEFLNALRKPPN
jgi:hypothetical protein